MATGLAMARTVSGGAWDPSRFPNAVTFFDTKRSVITPTDVRTQNGGVSLSQSGTTTTISGFTGGGNNVPGTSIVLSGWTNPGNNGTFQLVTATTFTNAAGVTEAAGTGKVIDYPGSVDAITDLVTGVTFTAPAALSSKLGINYIRGSGGSPVIGTSASSSRRFVEYFDPTGTMFAGVAGPNHCSFYTYIYLVTAGASNNYTMAMRDTASGGGAPTDLVAFYPWFNPMTGAKGGLHRLSSAGSAIFYTNNTQSLGAWYSIGCDYDYSANTNTVYVNGVAVTGSGGTGAQRATGTLFNAYFGLFTSVTGSSIGTNAGGAFIAASGVWGGILGPTRHAELEAYYRALYP